MKKIIIVIALIILLLGGWYIVVNAPVHTKNAHDHTKQTAKFIETYNFNLISDAAIQPNQETQVTFAIGSRGGEPLKNFYVNHEKLMHFIIIRDDLQDFQHVHPELDTNSGEFTIPLTFSGNGKYRLIADFVPAKDEKSSEQNHVTAIAYKDINVGNASDISRQEITPDTKLTKTDGVYEYTYSFPKNIEVNKPVKIVIQVKKNGQPVKNMEEYLGAQAHGILFKSDDLTFAHLHAMGEEMTHEMDGEMMTMHGPLPKGPEIAFDYTFPQTGIYKLFTQFQVEGEVITTDYTLQVK